MKFILAVIVNSALLAMAHGIAQLFYFSMGGAECTSFLFGCMALGISQIILE